MVRRLSSTITSSCGVGCMWGAEAQSNQAAQHARTAETALGDYVQLWMMTQRQRLTVQYCCNGRVALWGGLYAGEEASRNQAAAEDAAGAAPSAQSRTALEGCSCG